MKKLKDVCVKFDDGDWIESKDQSESGIRLIQTGNIGEGEFLEKTERTKYISEDTFERLKCEEVFSGDILVSRLPEPIGRACIIPFKTEKMITAVDCTICRVNEKVIRKEYLCYFMQSSAYYNQLKTKVTGTTRKRISRKNLGNIDLPILKLEDQDKIIRKLDCIKNIIYLKKKEILLLDNLIQSRFVEMFGDLADPKCVWNKVKLINVCKTPNDVKCGPFGTQLNKNEYQKKGVAVWEIPQINDEFTSEPIHFLTEKKAKILESYSVISGDIVMSRKGNIGKCAVFPDEYEKGIIHSDVLRIRVDAEQVNSQFMMRQLHYSRAIKHQIGTVSSGAIMAGINVTKLKQIYVHIPPIDLQNQFAAFVQQVNKSKFEVQKSLEKTQLLFDSLMQEYFG